MEKVLKENRFYVLGNDYQERKAYSGTVAYIPYIKDAEVTEDGSFQSGKIGIDYVSASNIFPISWSNGRVTECAFTFPKTVARKKYVQVQFHRMEQTVNGSQYVIENTVLECQSGSREGTELVEEEWKKLSPFRFLAKRIETGSPEPQFVIDRLNIVNNADMDESNPMGVAIYANAIDVLKSLDIKYDSYSNEIELGRKRIFVAPEMMKNVNGSIAFDPEDVTFYMMPDEYDKTQEGLIKEVNMDLRSEQHSGAINDDLNYLSLKCGFGTERYKFDCSGVKTATEVISENSDMYRMIKKHEVILEDVLKAATEDVIEKLYALLQGERVVARIDQNVVYRSLLEEPSSIYSLLLVAGYLKTPKKELQTDGSYLCEVSIPNWEIAAVYKAEILSHLLQIGAVTRTTADRIAESLYTNDVKKLQSAIAEYMDKSISFYDAGAEGFYHGLVLGLIALLDQQYKITSNREFGEGRYDISLFPRELRYPGILMELKWKKGITEDTLKKLAKEALNQIETQRYDTEMRQEGVTEVIKLGIAFSGKNVKIWTV